MTEEPSTRAPMVECRLCGEPFATERQIARVIEKAKLTEEVARTCPRCRRAQFRRQVEECLAGTPARMKE